MHGSNRQIIGGVGVVVLLVGVFGPFLEYSSLMHVSLAAYNLNAFLLLLLASITAALFVLTNRCDWLWVPGVAATVVTAWTNYAARVDLVATNSMQGSLRLPRESLRFLHAVQIEVEGRFSAGAYFLVVGSVLLLVAAALREGRKTEPIDSSRIGNAGSVIAKNFSPPAAVFHNVPVAEGPLSEAIDVVVCTPHGIFPILVKNYKGQILSISDTEWIQVVDETQTPIQHPLVEIVDLSRQLARTLGAKEEWVAPMVALVGEPEITFRLPEGVFFLPDAILEILSQTRSRYHNGIKTAMEKRLARLASGKPVSTG